MKKISLETRSKLPIIYYASLKQKSCKWSHKIMNYEPNDIFRFSYRLTFSRWLSQFILCWESTRINRKVMNRKACYLFCSRTANIQGEIWDRLWFNWNMKQWKIDNILMSAHKNVIYEVIVNDHELVTRCKFVVGANSKHQNWLGIFCKNLRAD